MQSLKALSIALVRRFAADRRGNIAWIYALSAIPVMAAAGAGVDVAAALNAKTALQDAIDAATLAGASAGNSASVAAGVYASEPLSKFALNGTPSFSVGADSSFTGTVNASLSTSFMKLVGISTLSVSATATAKQGVSSSTVCILVKNATASQALLMNSGADLEAPSCEVHVASTGSPAAIFNASTKLNAKKTCIAGTSIIDNGGTHPNMVTGCAVAADPYAGKLPVPSTSCTYNNWSPPNGVTSFTMSPGVYCGWVNFNSAYTITFSPGVYVIKNGGWNVNGGTWNGSGVTFYFADTSKIQFNSGVSANLSAPTSNTYAGLLMYEAPGLSSSQFLFDDSKGHSLSGIIYLPSRQMVMNSGSSVTSDQLSMVVDTLIVNSASWTVGPAPSTATTIAASGGAGGGAYLVK